VKRSKEGPGGPGLLAWGPAVGIRVQIAASVQNGRGGVERPSLIYDYQDGRGFHVKHFPLKCLTWFSQQGRMKALKPADLMRR
jgi:hypothetical protein